MIPLRDVIPTRTTPYATLALIAASALVFAYELSLEPRRLDAFVRGFGLVPIAFDWTAVATSIFLHASLLHVGPNLLCLWIFGETVEDRMGHGRFLAMYLLCGTAAALAQAAAVPDSPFAIVGSSGAVAGVMGAYFLLYPRSRVVTLVPIPFSLQVLELPAYVLPAIWLTVQFAMGAGTLATITASTQQDAALWGHAAGFVTGAAGVLVLRRPERLRVEWWNFEIPNPKSQIPNPKSQIPNPKSGP